MDDSDCVAFLQWALPRLGMRWAGFRKVRGQVCKRLRRRLTELGEPDLDSYRARLAREPAEWSELERLTHVTISRFHRDRATLAALWDEVLPALATDAVGRGDPSLQAWSAGCASGEEPYTLAIGWRLLVAGSFPGLNLRVLGTDVDETMLARARRGSYGAGSLRELPGPWRAAAFAETEGAARLCLRDEFRDAVAFMRHDVRRDAMPEGPFDLLLCRNLAFTYFDGAGQREVADRLAGVLRAGGALVVGTHEALPREAAGFEGWSSAAAGAGIYRRLAHSSSRGARSDLR